MKSNRPRITDRDDLEITPRLFEDAPAGFDNLTVAEARRIYRDKLDRDLEGQCPCCGDYQHYNLAWLEPGHCKALLYLANAHDLGKNRYRNLADAPFISSKDVQNWLANHNRGNSWTNAYVNNLIYWQFVVRDKSYKEARITGTSYGLKLTGVGRAFIEGAPAPRGIVVFQRYKPVGKTAELVTFQDIMADYDLSRFCHNIYGKLTRGR